MSEIRIHVRTPEDWSEALGQLDGFHDGVVRQVSIFGSDYVDTSRDLIYGSQVLAEILVQFQSANVSAAQIQITGMKSFEFLREIEFEDAPAKRTEGLLLLRFLSVQVIAESVTVRLLDSSYLGPNAQLTNRSWATK